MIKRLPLSVIATAVSLVRPLAGIWSKPAMKTSITYGEDSLLGKGPEAKLRIKRNLVSGWLAHRLVLFQQC